MQFKSQIELEKDEEVIEIIGNKSYVIVTITEDEEEMHFDAFFKKMDIKKLHGVLQVLNDIFKKYLEAAIRETKNH